MKSRITHCLLVALALALVSAPSSAQPAGDPFRVNSSTSLDQTGPSIAALTDGGFVVVWQSDSGYQDGRYGLFGQRYDATGAPISTEFRITPDSFQRRSSVAALSDGGFVVAWASGIPQQTYVQVRIQRYGSDGNPVGARISGGRMRADIYERPQVAGLTDGGFVVVRIDDSGSPTRANVHRRRYDASGQPVADDQVVNPPSTFNQRQPAVAGMTSGGFVITWTDGWSIRAQRYTQDDQPKNGAFVVNSIPNPSGSYARDWPAIAALTGGGFVITWQTNNDLDGSGIGIFGQLYRSNGNPIRREFVVNRRRGNHQQFSNVAGLSDGGFVVTFLDSGNPPTPDAQRYDSLGKRVGTQFQLSTAEASWPGGVAGVAGLTDGGFVAAWTGRNDRLDIFARRYEP